MIRSALLPPFEFAELIRQCDAIGSKSLPLVALAGAATGVVLSLQTRDSLTCFGAKSFLPAVIVFSIIKESGPVITGLMVSGRVGAGIGAELGSMRVTEQASSLPVTVKGKSTTVGNLWRRVLASKPRTHHTACCGSHHFARRRHYS